MIYLVIQILFSLFIGNIMQGGKHKDKLKLLLMKFYFVKTENKCFYPERVMIPPLIHTEE